MVIDTYKKLCPETQECTRIHSASALQHFDLSQCESSINTYCHYDCFMYILGPVFNADHPVQAAVPGKTISVVSGTI